MSGTENKNIYKTDELKDLLAATQERSNEKGFEVLEVKKNFVERCLKRVHPKMVSILNFVNDTEWKFVPKPDNMPTSLTQVLPGSKEEKELVEVKNRYYKQWLERLQKGEFDPKPPESKPKREEDDEEVDMVALANKEKEKADDERIVEEQEEEKLPVEVAPVLTSGVTVEVGDEDGVGVMEVEAETEVEDKQLAPMHANTLLTHLRYFVKEHAPVAVPLHQDETMKHLSDLQTEISKLKKSIPQLVADAIKARFE